MDEVKAELGFFGAGKMAEAILSAAATLPEFRPGAVVMAEKSPERARFMAEKYGVRVTPSAAEAAREARMLVLAVKPQDAAALAADVAPLLDASRLLVSIAAGKTIAALRKAFGRKVRIVRVMPNLALAAGEGMSAVAPAPNATPEDVAAVERLFGAAGRVVRLPERRFHAVTALSGSGPAFFAYAEQAAADAGRALGLPAAAAALLARQTMAGTAAYLRKTGSSCGDFIAAVSSKRGTTEAGMKALSARGAFRRLLAAAVSAAAKRSEELAGA